MFDSFQRAAAADFPVADVRAPVNSKIWQQLSDLLQDPHLAVLTHYPLQLNARLSAALLQANQQVVAQAVSPLVLQASAALVPEALLLGQAPARPHFLCVDFALCHHAAGLMPKLIELQAFPSQFAMCFALEQAYGETRLAGRSLAQRQALWLEMLIGEQPASAGEVIMLDHQPLQQKTSFSFHLTAQYGIAPVALTDLYRRGRELWYRSAHGDRRVRQIYNRLILADLPDNLRCYAQQVLTDADVSWVGHPDWYYLLSKASLLQLQGDWHLPTVLAESFFTTAGPRPDLRQYVCKPLFGYGSQQVNLTPTAEYLSQLPERQFILQQKTSYAPCVPLSDGSLLATEIRVLNIWPDTLPAPIPLAMMARTARGALLGMKHWQAVDSGLCGATVALPSDSNQGSF